MMQLTAFIRNSPWVGGVAHASVLDATGLDGSWDFTLAFSPEAQRAGNASAGGALEDSPAVAAAPTGRVTLFEAIESQLGLKLESTKRPGPVLVIDHMEQKPLQ